nr:hypothetical protein [Ralstonia pickettii]
MSEICTCECWPIWLRMRSLVEQLLVLAEQEANLPKAGSMFDAHAVVVEALGEIYPFAESKGVDLGMDTSEVVRLHGSERDFFTLVRNAIDNATLYTPTGERWTCDCIAKEMMWSLKLRIRGRAFLKVNWLAYLTRSTGWSARGSREAGSGSPSSDGRLNVLVGKSAYTPSRWKTVRD